MSWSAFKCGLKSIPEDLRGITPEQVVAAAKVATPGFITGATNKNPDEDRWDYTLYAYYRVKISGWYITLAVHRHYKIPASRAVTSVWGNMYIPGYSGWSTKPHAEFLGHFPAYEATVHVDGYCSNTTRQTFLFHGKTRYPTKAAEKPATSK